MSNSKKTKKRNSKSRKNTQNVKVHVKQKGNATKPIIVTVSIILVLGVATSIWGFLTDFKFDLPFGGNGESGLIEQPTDSESATDSDVDSESATDSGSENEDMTYVIRFDDSAGSGRVIDVRTTDKGLLEVFPSVTREGFTFLGWYDDEGKSYAAPFTFAESMTLSASWEAEETYTVTFIVDGGTYFTATTDASGKLVETPETPVKEGYAFKCWNKAADESGDVVSLQATFTQDETLYAIFTETQPGDGELENPDVGGDNEGDNTQTPEGGEGGENTEGGENPVDPDVGGGSEGGEDPVDPGVGGGSEGGEDPDVGGGSEGGEDPDVGGGSEGGEDPDVGGGNEGDGTEGDNTQTPGGSEGNEGDNTQTPDSGENGEGGENTEGGENPVDPGVGEGGEGGDVENPDNTGNGGENEGDGTEGDNTQTPGSGEGTEGGDDAGGDGGDTEGSGGASSVPSAKFSGTVETNGDYSTAYVPAEDFAAFAENPEVVLSVAEKDATSGVDVSFKQGESSKASPTYVTSKNATRYFAGQELHFKHKVDGKTITKIVFVFDGQLSVEDIPDCAPGQITYDALTDTTTVEFIEGQFTWTGEGDSIVFVFNGTISIINIDITYEL